MMIVYDRDGARGSYSRGLIEVGGQHVDLTHRGLRVSDTKKRGAQSDFLYKNWQQQIQTS